MGKHKSSRSKARKARKKSGDKPQSANAAKRNQARSQRALVLVGMLDSGDAQLRLQACMTVANVFEEGSDDAIMQIGAGGHNPSSGASDATATGSAIDQDDVSMEVSGENGTAVQPPAVPSGRLTDDSARISDMVDILRRNGAFKVLMKRVTDADPRVRLHACGALCTALTAWPPLASEFVADGIHEASLANVRQGLGESLERAEAVALSLHLLADLCNVDQAAVKVMQDKGAVSTVCAFAGADLPNEAILGQGADEIIRTAQAEKAARDVAASTAADSLETATVESAPLEVPDRQATIEHLGEQVALVSENAARLMHTALDANQELACAVSNSEEVLSALSQGAGNANSQERPTAKKLHCLGALASVVLLAGLSQEKARIVFATLVDQCTKLLSPLAESESAQASAANSHSVEVLALEILTNCCATNDEGLDQKVEERQAKAVREICDVFCQGGVSSAARSILSRCEAELRTPFAACVVPRACALLDNIIQNASDQVVQERIGLAELWTLCFRIIGTIVTEDSSAMSEECEEILSAVTALMWSATRRAQTLENTLSLPSVYVTGLLSAVHKTVSSHAKANLLGACGALASVGQVQLEQQDIRNLASALISYTSDVSIYASMQAVDSLIDIFAQEARDQMYDQLKVGSALQANVRRLRSALISGAKVGASAVDKNALSDVVANLEAFLQYKRDQPRPLP